MAVTPNSRVFTQGVQSNTVSLTTGNSTYGTSPTNAVLLVTAGPNGGLLTKMGAIPTVSITTSNQLQFFRSYDGGSTKLFAGSVPQATYTMAQTTQAPTTDFGYTDDQPLKLAPNERIYVAEGQSFAVNVFAEWENF